MRSTVLIAFFLILAGTVFVASIDMKSSEVQTDIVLDVDQLPDIPKTGESSSSPIETPSIPEPVIPPPVIEAEPEVDLAHIRAIHLTSCTAGSTKRRDQLIPLMKAKGLNAVIFDIKDYSGYVSYKMPNVPEVTAVGADQKICIRDLEKVIQEFRSNNIYVIGRLTVFQDSVYASAHPELALKNESGDLWRDNLGLAWLDPAGQQTWEYVESIASDAFERGFDEVNFDYIRFPSDGKLSSISYPFYDKVLETKVKVMNRFFMHLRQSLINKTISADLFGLVTSSKEDLGIGQTLEIAFPNFDYIAPMIYPSHFASGYKGIAKPAEEPFNVISRSMLDGFLKRQIFVNNNPGIQVAKFRPWLQAFNLQGVSYDNFMIYEQVRGVETAFASSTEALNGWMFWDPSNLYINL